MMQSAQLIDLTDTVSAKHQEYPPASAEDLSIKTGDIYYTARIYHFRHDSMLATYLDFPGHIRSTDDGSDAAHYPLDKLYRQPATVIHLHRTSGSGPVSASDLRQALPGGLHTPVCIINALGDQRYDTITYRSVYLSNDAAQWLASSGIHLLASDIYESDQSPQGVFPLLFGAGISTICHPINLHKLPTSGCRLTALPLRFPGVTQIPCRVMAEYTPH